MNKTIFMLRLTAKWLKTGTTTFTSTAKPANCLCGLLLSPQEGRWFERNRAQIWVNGVSNILKHFCKRNPMFTNICDRSLFAHFSFLPFYKYCQWPQLSFWEPSLGIYSQDQQEYLSLKTFAPEVPALNPSLPSELQYTFYTLSPALNHGRSITSNSKSSP